MSGRAPIFKMTSDARELGRIDLNISKSTGKVESIDWQVIPVTDQVKDDPAFLPISQKYGPLLKTLEQVVGRTDVELDVKSASVRTRETNMADFIADAFRVATGADVALENGGSIRADAIINPGVLTKRDVLSMLPFNNKVVKAQVIGSVIRAALEHGVATAVEEEQPGRFPQVSGLRYEFDTSRKPGARVTSITVNGKPLDERHSYALAATTYLLLDAGDGYDMFRGATLLIQPDQAQTESDILQKTIASVRSIAPKIDGRIKRIDAAMDQNPCK
jgi:5'-nucleotidase